MKIIFILPSEGLSARQLERACRSATYRFPEPIFSYAAFRMHRSLYTEVLGGQEILDRSDQSLLSAFDVVVYLEADKKLIPTAYSGFKKDQRVYKIDYLGKLNRSSLLDEHDYEHFETHPFNRAGPRHDDNFYYFPYGYLFRLTGMGPINEFGHRIRRDFEPLSERPANHVLVAVFGGSAAWSIFSFYEEMFSQRLEDKLNAHAREAGLPHQFTVLNFATPGNVVLNEMMTYMLYCHKLRPDVVIAHDGFNDLYYGEMSHPQLLNKYAITYQYNLEAWSQILHDTGEVQLGWTKNNVPVINYPHVIVDAYRFRLNQFRRTAENDGALFIAGLQPIIFSKKAMSPEETAWLPHFKPKEEAYRNMTYLYEKYCQTSPEKEYPDFLNFHRIFNEYGSETTLVGDIMHTVPNGDEVIAERYFRHFKEHLMHRLIAKGSNRV